MGVAPYKRVIHGDWVALEDIILDLYRILNVDTTLEDILTPPGSDGEVIYNNDGAYGADSTFSFDDVTKVLTAQVLKITSVAASVVDTDKFLVDDSDEIKFRTGAELLSDIGGSASGHLHDGATLQHDGVNSDGGAFSFTTTGLVTFNQSIASANYTAANLLTAAATNAGALDFSAASKTLTVEDNAIVSQDYTSDASPTFAGVTLTNAAVLGSNSSVFQPNADSTTFFQILDADGGTPVFNVDSTNERVGIGTASPSANFDVVGTTTLQVTDITDRVDVAVTDPAGDVGARVTQTQTVATVLPIALASTISTTHTSGTTTLPVGYFGGFEAASNGAITFGLGVRANAAVTGAYTPAIDFLVGLETSVEGAGGAISFGVGGLFNDPTIGAGSYIDKWAAMFLGDIQVSSDMKIILEGSLVSKGDTYLVYDSGNATLDCFVNATEVWNASTTTFTVPVNTTFGAALEVAHTEPYLTLRNRTAEDADGGRESRINFKGEQSGTEETTLARIEAGHDGAIDNEMGYLDLYTNEGSDGDSPSKRIRIDSKGLTTKHGTPILRSSTTDAKYDTAGWLYVVGKYCYMTAYGADTLNIVDVTEPTSPVIISQLTDAVNLEGSECIIVVGTYAYITCTDADRFIVVDVSDPTNPAIVGNLHDATQLNAAEGMDIVGKYAFVTCYWGNRVTVVDISDPTTPVVVDTLNDAATLSRPVYIKVRGNYAYVGCRGTAAANATCGMTILDVSDPTNIAFVNRIGYDDDNLINWPSGVDVDASYAYLNCTESDSLVVIDISDPANLSVHGSLTDSTNLNYIMFGEKSGNYVYAACQASDSLAVIDVSDPSTPVLSTVLIDAVNMNGVDDCMIQGKYAYLTSNVSDFLIVIEISGASLTGVDIDNLYAQRINTADDAIIGRTLHVMDGITTGAGGILSNGPLATSSLVSVGDSKFGGGGFTNYTQIAADGIQTMAGTARVKKIIQIQAATAATHGGANPSVDITGNYLGMLFGVNDIAYYEFEIPYDCDVSEAIEIELHWFINEAQGDDPEEFVKWQIDYSATSETGGEAVDAGGGNDGSDTAEVAVPDATPNILVESELEEIAGGFFEQNDVVGLKLTRIASSHEANGDPVALSIEIEYVMNKLGEAT